MPWLLGLIGTSAGTIDWLVMAQLLNLRDSLRTNTFYVSTGGVWYHSFIFASHILFGGHMAYIQGNWDVFYDLK